jgi:hypothetical protein
MSSPRVCKVVGVVMLREPVGFGPRRADIDQPVTDGLATIQTLPHSRTLGR